MTKTIPKSLLPVAGKPFISHQLNLLRFQGIERVVICVGNLGEKIESFVGSGADFGLSVSYSYDGAQLLGTGGALRRAVGLLGPEFFVLYGDSYLPIKLDSVQKAFDRSKKPALMTVLKNENQWDRSNAKLDAFGNLEYDKDNPREDMKYIDYGLGVVSGRQLLDFADDEIFDLANFYRELSLAGNLAGFEVYERFYEIGTRDGLLDTENYIIARGNTL